MEGSFQIPIDLIDSESASVSTYSGEAILEEIEKDSLELFQEAVDAIKTIRKHHVVVTATSFGKDSTVVLLAALRAHIELIQEGKLAKDAPFVLTNIDTGVENHLVQILAMYEIDRLREFAESSGINVDIRIGTPPLAKQWAALFLSGLKIISSARVNSDCAEIMKIETATRIEKAVSEDYDGNVVTLLGSRLIAAPTT